MSEILKNKLFNYEVTPPEGTWEKIASSLDDSYQSHEFPSNLYNMEVPPPASAWALISEKILPDSIKREPGRRILPFLRYAAAAAIIGLIAFAGTRIFNNKKSIIGQTSNGIAQTIHDNIGATIQEIVPANQSTNEEDEARNDAALNESKKTMARLDFSVGNRLKNIRNDQLRVDPGINGVRGDEEETFKELHESGIPAAGLVHEDPNITSASRYIMLMTPDGNVIRMSKKLSDMVCCVSGEDQNDDCSYQMCKWREKIASAPVVPAPGNFMDILGLVKYLQDK